MPTQRFDAVLFDCDGVLVDSEPITNRVLADMLGELGARLSLEETIRTFVGKAVWQEFALIGELTGRPVPEGFYDEYKRRRDDALRDTIEAVPGIEAVFDACASAGLPVAVASGAERAKMHITLGRTGLLPRLDPHVYGADQVARSKPHPDVYLLAAGGLRVDPARCLVIEDTPTGTQAGVAAGATVFGYCAANDPRALLGAGATMVFDDMRRLADLLRA
ncbi:MAG TPA: HAD family phosphatase [Quisquiliibacterium sp.]|nr:HAD family phosphatase [Quisquiliibacterium sp.]HQD83288.1 HAD family phosphatase [Quisquiliibacterium sp.]